MPQYYYKNDPDSGYDISTNFSPKDFRVDQCKFRIWSNELGCFDTPFKGEKEAILLAGDSFTFGYAPFESKWGYVLEKETGIRVLKCGVSGYGTRQEFLKIKMVVRLTQIVPKIIIVGYYQGNDFDDDYIFPHYSVINGYLVTKVRLTDIKRGEKIIYSDHELKRKYDILRVRVWLLGHSITLNAVLDLLFKNKEQPADFPLDSSSDEEFTWPSQARKDHFNNIKAVKKYADQIGSHFLLVIIPKREQVYNFLPKAKHARAERFGDELKGFLWKEDIDFIDLLPEFRRCANLKPRESLDSREDLYWRSDDHWNIKGNHLACLVVALRLMAGNLIEVKEREIQLQQVAGALQQCRHDAEPLKVSP